VSEKAAKVQSIFSSIAPSYDVANSVISLGQDHAWRRKTVKLSEASAGQKVLDVATGTGDLAIAFKKAVGTTGEVIGVDFCAEMLIPAPDKAKKNGFSITFQQGDAMDLKFADASFDVVSIAYGLRNVADTAKAVREMSRVLKPGGKLMILETGRSEWPVFSTLVDFYTGTVMPIFGGLLSGNKDAYQYLDRSSRDFPYGKKLVELLEKEGGFKTVEAHPLIGGVSYIYRCTKP
jgi:demethylmenaquinone methyltransferase/2-methoxy-6-polyprenyl-1,4-benzoquinol methylase